MERDVHVSTAQFGRERCGDLEDNIQFILGGLIDDGCNGNRREEGLGGAVVHRNKTSLGTGEVKNMLLLESFHIHRLMVIHIINKDSTRRSLSRATANKVVVESDMKSRTAIQLVADKNISLDRAVDEITLYMILRG